MLLLFLAARSRFSLLISFVLLTLTVFGAFACASPARGATDELSRSAPLKVSLPSAVVTGDARNDRIPVSWYEPTNLVSSTRLATSARFPAVVLLHYLGASTNREMHDFARYLAARGVASAVVTLPYHMERLAPGDSSVRHYFASDPDSGVQTFRQASSDVSTVVTWILAQPEIDAKRIGIAGISLGAIVTHLAMGQDERLSAGVAMLGAGDLPEIYRHSVVGRLFFHTDARLLTPQAIAKLRAIDPLTYAARNRPGGVRRVLMIEAARDSFVPKRAAEELWEALGRPPIQWLDTNHPALSLVPRGAMNVTYAYLQSVWNGESSTRNDAKIPRLWVPTIKSGVIFGLDSVATPAIQWQMFGLGTREHMALLHADLGLTGRGPFLGLAATVNQYIDLGLGRRFSGHDIKPYVSVHIVF